MYAWSSITSRSETTVRLNDCRKSEKRLRRQSAFAWSRRNWRLKDSLKSNVSRKRDSRKKNKRGMHVKRRKLANEQRRLPSFLLKRNLVCKRPRLRRKSKSHWSRTVDRNGSSSSQLLLDSFYCLPY